MQTPVAYALSGVTPMSSGSLHQAHLSICKNILSRSWIVDSARSLLFGRQSQFFPWKTGVYLLPRFFASVAQPQSSRASQRAAHSRLAKRRGQLQQLNGDLGETERLQKFLSRSGICSRRVAEDHIRDGRISINGKVVRELGVKVKIKDDVVTFDGDVINLLRSEPVWLAMHKPRGFISSVRDERGRPTVMELLTKAERDIRVIPVGRLDRDSSGLLLFTNDYPWIDTLTHPRFQHEKEYVVDVMGTPSTRAIRELQGGIKLPDDARATVPIEISVVGEGERRFKSRNVSVTRLALQMREGRNHQIRNMMEVVGHPVVRLHRVSFAGIGIGGLRRGECRYLTSREIKRLKRTNHAPSKLL